MRIDAINSLSIGKTGFVASQYSKVAFKRYNPSAAKRIEKELAQKGITCQADGNNFVAESYKKIVDIFTKLFGKSYLPGTLGLKSLGQYAYGQYNNFSNEIVLNSDFTYGCYYDLDSLKKEAAKNYNSILPSWNSSGHPAHVFVHEFAHAAHWHHLEQRNGYSNALKVWKGLAGTTVPTAIGRLITKFKLSKYAVDGNDMCEFLAERMAKDICEGLTDNQWVQWKKIDVDYSNIFSRKWDYRYTSPQSYIDYFTQQVWNGDIEEANRTGVMVDRYLAELETKEVSPLVQTVANKLNPSVEESTSEDSLFSRIGSVLSRALLGVNREVTHKLDERNKIMLKH